MSSQRERPAAITDVARAAGVSYQTVSRVINNMPRVRAETRERVLAAIEELGYRPNGAARALVTGRGDVVAVLATNTTLYGYAATIEGIEAAARSAGYTVSIMVLEPRGGAAELLGRLRRQPLAGVIVLSHDAPALRALRQIPPDLPVVAVGGSRTAGRIQATLDDGEGAAHATRYLLGLGHRTVHHVAIPVSGPRPGPRLLGWRRALTEAGAPVPDAIQGTWEPRSGYEAGLALAGMPGVTAVLAGNDDLAVGVIRACHERGIRVPDDISVVGFDDQPTAEFCVPSLTTMRQDFVAIGRRSFDLLAARLRGDENGARTQIAKPELIVRESTAPPGR